jgi:hypothetical protein
LHYKSNIMKKILIRYGSISSLLIVILMTLSLTFDSQIGYDFSYIVGYASMVIAFSVIYFALLSYYKTNSDAKISFGRSISIGLLITLIASVVYVIVWLIMYYTVFPDFWDKYGVHMVEKLRKTGASQDAINKQILMIKEYKEMYKNPLINGAFTFIEPLPVGILISLISAGIIQTRKKKLRASQS